MKFIVYWETDIIQIIIEINICLYIVLTAVKEK